MGNLIGNLIGNSITYKEIEQGRNRLKKLYMYKTSFKKAGTPVLIKKRRNFLNKFLEMETEWVKNEHFTERRKKEHDFIMLIYAVVDTRLIIEEYKDSKRQIGDNLTQYNNSLNYFQGQVNRAINERNGNIF